MNINHKIFVFGMVLILMNLEILVAQESKQNDEFYSATMSNQYFDSSTQDDNYKKIGATNNILTGTSNLDDVDDHNTDDHDHENHSTNDCLDSHQDCTTESSSEFANTINCQTNPLTRFHCKKSCQLCDMPRCDFITSHHDAQGGSDELIKKNVATVDECIKLVNNKRIEDPSLGINGMTYTSAGSKSCYAEKNDTRIGFLGCRQFCQTCIFNDQDNGHDRWIYGKGCPKGTLQKETIYQMNTKYNIEIDTLETAKEACADACNNIQACYYAVLKYKNKATDDCTLVSDSCGDWMDQTDSPDQPDRYFYKKDCYEANTDFEGFDVPNRNYEWDPENEDQRVIRCKDLCKQHEGCKYFTLKDNYCNLKTSDAGRHFHIGATSGIAKCETMSGYN